MAEGTTRADDARALPHLRALDGLRGMALLFVLLFHSGFRWVQAGYLPLSSFFVLSGFLITALLLLERQRTGSIDLRAFWRRRARRLAPGMLLGLGLVALYVSVGARERPPHLEGDAIATIAWLTNWRFISTGQTYADTFSDPSPLQHFWSLAVEEQFYLVLPLLAVALLAWRGKRGFVVVVSLLTVASVGTMRVVHQPGDAPLRAYLGTDTRAAELLIGVLLACALIGPRGLRRADGGWRHLLNVGSVAAIGGLVWSWIAVPAYSDAIFEGGLAALALVAAVVVAACTDPRMAVSRVLGTAPLVALGRISYGVYLFHWPVFLFLQPDRVALAPWPLFAVRLTVSVALAAASFHLVEHPIRMGRIPSRAALVGWANGSVAAVALTAVALAQVPTPRSEEIPYLGRDDATTIASGDVASAPVEPPTTSAPAPTDPPPPVVDPTTPTVAALSPPPTSAPATLPPAPVPSTLPPAPVRVLVVGDSLGDNLAYGLDQWSQQTNRIQVSNRSLLGCMVTRGGERRVPSGASWPIPATCEDFASTWPGYLDTVDPDVVLVVTGVNEIWDRKVDGWTSFRAPGEREFDAWMLREYAAAASLAGSRGAAVVWVGAPCVQYRTYEGFIDDVTGNTRIDHLRSSLLPVLAAQGRVTLADLHGVACPGGVHTDSVYGIGDARPDGVHFSAPATVEIARRYLGPLILQTAGR